MSSAETPPQLPLLLGLGVTHQAGFANPDSPPPPGGFSNSPPWSSLPGMSPRPVPTPGAIHLSVFCWTHTRSVCCHHKPFRLLLHTGISLKTSPLAPELPLGPHPSPARTSTAASVLVNRHMPSPPQGILTVSAQPPRNTQTPLAPTGLGVPGGLQLLVSGAINPLLGPNEAWPRCPRLWSSTMSPIPSV